MKTTRELITQVADAAQAWHDDDHRETSDTRIKVRQIAFYARQQFTEELGERDALTMQAEYIQYLADVTADLKGCPNTRRELRHAIRDLKALAPQDDPPPPASQQPTRNDELKAQAEDALDEAIKAQAKSSDNGDEWHRIACDWSQQAQRYYKAARDAETDPDHDTAALNAVTRYMRKRDEAHEADPDTIADRILAAGRRTAAAAAIALASLTAACDTTPTPYTEARREAKAELLTRLANIDEIVAEDRRTAKANRDAQLHALWRMTYAIQAEYTETLATIDDAEEEARSDAQAEYDRQLAEILAAAHAAARASHYAARHTGGRPPTRRSPRRRTRQTLADKTTEEVRAETKQQIARQLVKAADAHRAAARWLRQLGGDHTLVADRHNNQARDLTDEAKTLREQTTS